EDLMEGRTGTTAPGVRWVFGRDRKLYGYRDYDPQDETFTGLSILDLAEGGQGVRHRVWADRARWSGGEWQAVSGWQRDWKEADRFPAPERFRSLSGQSVPVVETPEFFASRERSLLRGSRVPEEMSFEELRAYVKETRRSGYDTTRLV